VTSTELHSRITDNESFVILGQSLLPLRIGHVELLAKFGCEFPGNPGELALAVLICAQEPKEVVGWFQSRLFKYRMAWLKTRLGEWDFQAKLAMWSEYWDHNTKLPTVIMKQQRSGTPNGIPFHQVLRVILLSRLNYQPADIRDTLYLQALWDATTLQQRDGLAIVASEDIDDLPDLTEAEEASIQAQALAVLKAKEEN